MTSAKSPFGRLGIALVGAAAAWATEKTAKVAAWSLAKTGHEQKPMRFVVNNSTSGASAEEIAQQVERVLARRRAQM